MYPSAGLELVSLDLKASTMVTTTTLTAGVICISYLIAKMAKDKFISKLNFVFLKITFLLRNLSLIKIVSNCCLKKFIAKIDNCRNKYWVKKNGFVGGRTLSSGYGRRLIVWWLWVRIPEGHFFTPICYKICNVFW